MTPNPATEPHRFLEHLYHAAVRRALPLHNTAASLPPPPKGRTIVLGAGKAGGSMAQAVEAQATTRFDRAHFKGYGDWALEFEVVYYVLDPDYNLYMDVQQQLNLAIYERFAAKGVEFAFPTHTILVREVKRALRPALADYGSEKGATRSTG